MKFLLSGFADEAGVTIEEQMDALEKNSVKFIEMRAVNGKHVLQWDDAALTVIKCKMDKRGFALSAIGSPVGKSSITDPFDADLERFKRAVYCAKFFGCKYVRAFSFYPPKEGNREEYWGEAMRRVKEMVAIAEGNGVIFALENESGIFTDKLEPCIRFFEELKSPALCMALDPGNFVHNGVEPYPEAYNALKGYIGYFHIKDAIADKFVPSGEGDSNMAALLKAAYGGGFNGFLSVEPHLNYMADLTKAQQFTVACNALKKTLNNGLNANLELTDINSV